MMSAALLIFGQAAGIFLLGADTMTAPELEKEVKEAMANATELVFDLKDLEYISSAGLRVLFSLFKLAKQNMVIRNAGDIVMEVFNVTGFADVFQFE